jgi:PKD repeat protein
MEHCPYTTWINHGSDVPKNLVDSIKQAGSLLLHSQGFYNQPIDQDESSFRGPMEITPVVNASFKGNGFNFFTPPDNSMAVSDDGFVVSAVNSSLLFSDVNGNVLQQESFDDFLAFLNLHGNYFDPKVLYDPEEDKFILVVLNGNTPATSTIVVCFSSASNPTANWWVYTYSGDPGGFNVWTDYPSVGISTTDLYISGNQFTPDNNFSQCLIYQLKKSDGFVGGNVNGTSFYDVRDAYGLPDFTVLPVSFGFDGSVGPGIYFISTDPAGGSEATLYYTDNDSQHNPSLFAYAAQIQNYYMPFNGLMLGTTEEIKTNDCKVQSAYYAEGTLHFVFDTRGDDFHTKVYYCRLNTTDLTNTSVQIGLQPYEYAFPAIAPFTNNVNDKTALIGFLRTSSAIYPEFRTIAVDNDMNFTNSVLIKEGNSFVNVEAANKERWGDYTGISRRHSANGAEVWVSGSFGEDNENNNFNILGTWIAQVTSGQVATAPVANFKADHVEIMAGQSVQFSDLSSNQPTTWTWTFAGGNPGNSNQQNPTVTYDQPGTYDVSLTATNAFGNDVVTKQGYIIVSPVVQMPMADFTADITTVNEGGVVHFQDLTSNTPNKWQWFFPGGTPSLSGDQNPVVTYTEPGCHNVTLDAYNTAGVDVITKTCYIDVLATSTHEVDTFFQKFIVFPNPVSMDVSILNLKLNIPLNLILE